MIDFKYLKGQEHVKRALEVALAGNHSVMLWGQPGVGKSLFLQASIDMLSSLGKSGYIVAVQDGLTGPTLASSKRQAEIGTTPVLAASKPCPCGYFGDTARVCTCTADEIRLFFSSDALDLIKTCTIQAEMPLVEYEKLSDHRLGESSEKIGARICRAWAAQVDRTGTHYDEEYFIQARQKPTDPVLLKNLVDRNPKRYNQQATLEELQDGLGPYALGQAAQTLLKAATRQLQFPPRSYFDSIKLGRTIADLAGDKAIQASHLAEAIQYRRKHG